MTVDQRKGSPFFELLDNETDTELALFTSARQADTKDVRKAAVKKIIELLKVLTICDELEGKN